jgi:enoyl-CoA hydratase/carnithine racemase
MDSARAHQLGLVSEVLPREALWDRAHELAALMASRPPAAVQGTIRVLWDALDMPRAAALSAGIPYTMLGNPLAQAQMPERDSSRKV